MDRLAKMEAPKPASWFGRAICYDKLQRRPKPIEAYQKFLELDNGQNETQDFRRAAVPIPCKASWGRRRKNRNAERMTLPGMLKFCTAAFAALALFAPLAAQDRLTVEQAPVRSGNRSGAPRLRALVKLGDEQIDEARKQLKNGDDVASLHTLEQYRDEVRHIAELLKATGVDPEKQTAGFKELQISLRETVRPHRRFDSHFAGRSASIFPRSSHGPREYTNELMTRYSPRQPDRNSRKP